MTPPHEPDRPEQVVTGHGDVALPPAERIVFDRSDSSLNRRLYEVHAARAVRPARPPRKQADLGSAVYFDSIRPTGSGSLSRAAMTSVARRLRVVTSSVRIVK